MFDEEVLKVENLEIISPNDPDLLRIEEIMEELKKLEEED